MKRAVAMMCVSAWAIIACGADEPTAPIDPGPMLDAQITPVLDTGPLEHDVRVPMDPRDAAITEPTPILDLPLVIARPNEPLSTASIDVLVVDPQGAPVADVSVSTGGPAVLTSPFGLARVTAVYGRDFSNVFAFGAQHTLTHARIPIRADESSQVVLMVAPVEVLRLEDSALGGVVEASQLQVTFQAASLELPWGGTAKGPSMVSATLLAAAEQAASVPAGMMARVDGELVPVAGLYSFELRVAQGSTELALLADATVQLPSSAAVAGIDVQQLTLYYFDAKESAFVPKGALDLSQTGGVGATIDQLGHWLIGSHDAQAHCARVDVQSASGPLPHAGILLSRSGPMVFGAARVEADASGSGCALVPIGGELRAFALGKLGEQLVSAQGALAASTEPAACDQACATTVLQGEPIQLGCVTGRLSIPWYGTSQLPVSVIDALGEGSVSLPANGEFCTEVRAGAQLALRSLTETCTNGGVLIAQAPATSGASCSDDTSACTDVGTISCCSEQEMCLTLAGDDDCDGMTDEGCACGSEACTWSTAVDRCCSADGHCGERATFTGECVGLEAFGIPIGCPSAEVPIAEGGTTVAMGCCRSNGECGLIWGALGCVAAADVPKVWGPSVTLSSVACMP